MEIHGESGGGERWSWGDGEIKQSSTCKFNIVEMVGGGKQRLVVVSATYTDIHRYTQIYTDIHEKREFTCSVQLSVASHRTDSSWHWRSDLV